MPLIHFAFGSKHRSGDTQGQLQSFIELILLPKRLRAFSCPEFRPMLNNPNALVGLPSSAVPIGNAGMTYETWVPALPVSLFPVDVWMISFVSVAINKLKSWRPGDHYGRLGIAFKNGSKIHRLAKQVEYYQYWDLSLDPKVRALHQAIESKQQLAIQKLSSEIVSYRKPARLWQELQDRFAVLKLTANAPGSPAGIEKIGYSRYDVGYDFISEKEWRIVTEEDSRNISFEEDDVLAIVVPDHIMREQIEIALSGQWQQVPRIYVVS